MALVFSIAGVLGVIATIVAFNSKYYRQLSAAYADAPEAERPFVYLTPRAGTVLMWESWLRHEVPPNAAKSDRISISFNYA